MTPVARESLAPALAPFGQSSTLPSEAYTSESVFRWELEHFFDAVYQFITMVARGYLDGKAARPAHRT